MDGLFHSRPRHATVVAYLALFVALGGSSYAALRVGSGQIVNNSVRSKDIRNNDIGSRDVRDRSLLAKDFQAGQLPAGPQGIQGDTGRPGAPGSALAYARVDGTTVEKSKNIAQGNVSNPSPGLFCFNGLSFTPQNVVATFVSLGGVIQVRLSDQVSSACTGAQAQVITTNSSGGFANQGFSV